MAEQLREIILVSVGRNAAPTMALAADYVILNETALKNSN